MSIIEKLLIRGIRSFGPSEKDQAIVTFNTPVTLIVGQNGAGKTTIIECLKYSATGDLPPNSKGGAFVIDPKLIGEREVKAAIKLKFRDVTGTEVVCHRILQSEQKPKKIEQRHLDGSLEKKDKHTGEKIKISTRCTEINVEMIRHLGVSKAILTHVIFCHQEESNWPLSEGKALKTKFDEIFASTRYSKALETIKKLKTEQQHQCSQYFAELKYLKEQKLKADELKHRLDETQKKVDASKAEVTRLSNELNPVEDKLHQLRSNFEKVSKIERDIVQLKTSKKELEKQQQVLMDKIEHQFTGSHDELQIMYKEHEFQLQRSQRSLEECEHKLSRVCQEEDGLKQEINKLSEEYGRLESEEKHYHNVVQNRDTRIGSLAKQLGISGYNGPLSDEAVRQFMIEVTKQSDKRREQAERDKSELIEKEQHIQSRVTDLRDNLSRLKQKKEMKDKQLSDHEKQIQLLNRQLARIGSANADFDRLDLELKQSEDELREYCNSVDINQLEKELQELSDNKKRATDQLHLLQQEQSKVTQQSTLRGALEIMQKDKQNKEQQYRKEFAQVETDLLTIMGFMPSDEDLESSVTDLEKRKRSSLSQFQSNVNKWSSDQSRLQAQIDEKLKQVKGKQDQLEGIEAEIQSVCGSVSFDDKMKEVKDELSSTEDNLMAVKGSQAFFRQCLNKARSSEKCPLCARGYDSQDGLDSLITSIERRLTSKVPELIDSYQQQMTKLQSVHQQLLQLTPQLAQAKILRNKDIPQLEHEVSEKKGTLQSLQADIKKAESQLAECQDHLGQLRKLHPQVFRLTQLQNDLCKLDKNIATELSKLGENESVRSHAVVQRELQKAQMLTDDLGRKMDNKRHEITSSQSSIRDLENRIHQLKNDQLSLQKQVQERQTHVNKKEELTTNNEGLKREIEVIDRQLKPLEQKLTESDNERRRLTNEREQKESQYQNEFNQLEHDIKNVRSLTQQVNNLQVIRLSGTLENCKTNLKDLQQQVDRKLKEKEEYDEQKENLRKQLTNAKVRQRELEDNLELLKNKKEVKEKEKRIQDLQDQLQQQGLDQYNREYQCLQSRSENLTKELGLTKGRLQGFEGEVRSIQRDLQSEMYRDAEKRHRDMSIMLKTTQIANGDLDKYYKALDRAIMRFHSIKMEEINKIIKELWMKTYKGGDIDTIEIRSDDDPEGTASTGRRTYNYRVVMIKGDTVLDMRGRCSAGQKVLASIIIRLALAESFCLHCGLLALDEPTTNLDRDNIEGLAESLADIIRERCHQKNFQLIIITHDLNFVEMLGRSEFVEDYYLVKKEIGSCSTVKKIPINELTLHN